MFGPNQKSIYKSKQIKTLNFYFFCIQNFVVLSLETLRINSIGHFSLSTCFIFVDLQASSVLSPRTRRQSRLSSLSFFFSWVPTLLFRLIRQSLGQIERTLLKFDLISLKQFTLWNPKIWSPLSPIYGRWSTQSHTNTYAHISFPQTFLFVSTFLLFPRPPKPSWVYRFFLSAA